MKRARLPAVAGAFYESVPERLQDSMKECFLHELGPGHLPSVAEQGARQIVGMVCPHAGFHYSGAAAAWAYDALAADGKPDCAVLLGTNHRLLGPAIALSAFSAWATPLGRLPIDAQLCSALRDQNVPEDDAAHEFEHSIEVQLPWLQFLYGDTMAICPISLGHLSRRSMQTLADIIVKAIGSRNAVIIASSDFSHEVSDKEARRLDSLALERILSFDPEGLMNTVEENMLTMCGVAPVSVMLTAARQMHAAKATQLSYHTSGDINGNRSAVVGYASIIVKR